MPSRLPALAAVGVARLDGAGGGFMTLLKQCLTDEESPDCRTPLRGCGDRIRLGVSYAAADTVLTTFSAMEDLPAGWPRPPQRRIPRVRAARLAASPM